MNSINAVIVQRLCKFMGEKDISQYKLAELSGLPYPTIKSIMQKRTNGISLKTIILLADGLDITPSEFLNDDAFLAKNLDFE